MTPQQRSALMSRIRGKDTAPEKTVRSLLWRQGFRFRLHAKDIRGRPDIVLPKWRAVVLVHGCFWHGHDDCRLFQLPATRAEFWRQKLAGNRARDHRTITSLLEAKWRVAVVWECALKCDSAALGHALGDWIRADPASAEFFGQDGLLKTHPLSASP